VGVGRLLRGKKAGSHSTVKGRALALLLQLRLHRGR
jgi:hypothetical protein